MTDHELNSLLEELDTGSPIISPKAKSKMPPLAAANLQLDIETELNELLGEMVDSPPYSPVKIASSSNQSRKYSQSTRKSRICYPTHIGGSEPEGLTDSVNKRICNNLYCKKCDLKVIRVSKGKWSDTADYLFFRNKYPKIKDLKQKFTSKFGWSAYCCNCTWLSSNKLVVIQPHHHEIQWTCRGHTS